jgi:hypothetical protein
MARILLIPSGAIVWAVHFAAIYGVTALACARGFPNLVPWTVAIAGCAAAALLVLIVRAAYMDEFVGWTTGAIALAALLAVAWESAAGLLVPACV